MSPMKMKTIVLNALAALGVLSLAACLALGMGLWWLSRDLGRRLESGSPPFRVSPVAERIATQLTPGLQSLATENKEAIIAASGGVATRLAVRSIYPAGVSAIPYATQIGCDRALSYLDGLSVAELVAMMTEHARANGHRVPPSTPRQAGIR